MHIPDGFLSPQTCVVAYGISIPFIYKSFREVIKEESVARLGLLAALSFVVMMINIPVPGGSSGHAIGTSLIAILFGPWKATAAVSVVLAIQALLFGDGGVTTYGANVISMAIVPAFAGFWIWKLWRKRQKIAYFISGYISLLLSAAMAAGFLSLQPLLFSMSGKPLYFPYGPSVAFPAMLIPALAFFGPIEGILNLAILSYLRKRDEGRT